jgi:hypothetical protein
MGYIDDLLEQIGEDDTTKKKSDEPDNKQDKDTEDQKKKSDTEEEKNEDEGFPGNWYSNEFNKYVEGSKQKET